MSNQNNQDAPLAEEYNLIGQQPIQDNTDLDTSWRMKGPQAAPSSEIAENNIDKDQEANRAAKKAYQKISEILGDDPTAGMVPQSQQPQQPQQNPQNQQFVMRQNPQGELTMDDLMEGMNEQVNNWTQQSAADIYHQGYEDPNEASMMMEEWNSPPRATGGSWSVTKAQAKLKSGSKVPVWMVNNESTGMEIKKPFRIQEAAQRVASVLNQSGNVNDPRINSIMEAYDQHIKLMKEIRVAKKAIKEGQTDRKPRLRALQEKLEEVNYKLGI